MSSKNIKDNLINLETTSVCASSGLAWFLVACVVSKRSIKFLRKV
jgi:hypothetical protein